jgi:putative glutamine amidotransferase
MGAPLVLVTSIPRMIDTTLPGQKANATVDQRFGALITEASGIPVASDAWGAPDALIDRVDALVINGGTDVDPSRYGAERGPSTDAPDLRRDTFEFGLVDAAIRRGIPMLGVCRGMQLLNVALGGTLTQSLSTAVDHYVAEPNDRPVHPVQLEAGSAMARAFAPGLVDVNSIHHQAIDLLGEGLLVVGWAPDGTIEAMEDAAGRILGVQWHPEFLSGRHAERQVGLFRTLLAHCDAGTVA